MFRQIALIWLALFLVGQGVARGQETGPSGPFRLLAVQAERTQVVTNQQVQVGHLTLFFDRGKVTRLTAGGQEVGLHFQGEGRFRYLSTDPRELGLFTANAEALLKAKVASVEGGAQLEGKIERIILWTRNVDTGTQGETDPLPAREAFSRDLQVCEHLYFTPYIQKYGLHEFNAPTKPFAFALLFLPGRKGPQLVYGLDQACTFQEDLLYLRLPRADDPPVPRLTSLSRTAIGWDFRQPIAASFQLRHIDLDLTAAGDRALACTVEESIVPQVGGQRVFSMGLLSHRFSLSKNGTWVELTQKVVRLEDSTGTAIPHLMKNDALTFVLPRAAPVGQPFRIRCQVAGEILDPDPGDRNWRLDAGDCFPCPELLKPGAFFTVKARVKTKAPWLAIVGGATITRRQEGGYNIVESSLDKPVGYYTILGADYKLREQTRDGQTIRLAMYGQESRIADQLINLSFGIIKYYEHILGTFPFKEFTVVQDNSYGWGQAPPGLMVITNEAFGVSGTINDRFFRGYFSKGINQRFAHEIAHQYWGHLAKWPNPEEQWLSEAFAQYCSALTLNVVKTGFKASYDTALESARAHASRFTKAASIPMANYLSYGEDDYWTHAAMRMGLIYEKGAVLLGALRKEAGDEALLKAFRGMLYADPWGFRTTAQFIGLLNQATGKDWQPWFERYY